jgi:RPA family protein
MMKREPAWRVLSGEFNSVKFMLKSEGSKEPNYALTPLGAMLNRVFVVGEAVGMDDLGDEDHSFYRIKITDPTGMFYLAIGQYQPTAMKAARDIIVPSYIAVVGKVRSFEPEGGGLYLQIRPEAVYSATSELRNYWLLCAAKSLQNRLEAVAEVQNMSNPSAEQLEALGYSKSISSGIIKAFSQYGNVSLEPYQTYLRDTLQFLASGNGNTGYFPTGHGSESQYSIRPGTDSEPPVVSSPSGQNESSSGVQAEEEAKHKQELEKKILKILDKGANSAEEGLNWNEMLMQVKKEGIDKRAAEDTVKDLLERGVLYEPIIGTIRKI